MNEAAERLADKGVGSIFPYTHEAHQGEHYPHHESMADKIRAAQGLREHYNVNRPIYIDDIAGDCHIAYGGRANMTWIFNRSGTALYRANWTDAKSAENAVL